MDIKKSIMFSYETEHTGENSKLISEGLAEEFRLPTFVSITLLNQLGFLSFEESDSRDEIKINDISPRFVDAIVKYIEFIKNDASPENSRFKYVVESWF